VTRTETERLEALACGGARLIGTDPEMLDEAVTALMSDPSMRSIMQSSMNPFGDGEAAERIVTRLLADLARNPHDGRSGAERSEGTSVCMSI
jgi:UDP-N-acetylglucosamine 2-epimerase (non-hydrolysing)